MVRREILPNGLRVLVRELKGAPIVALNLWVGSGSIDDPDELSGLSHFVEHMLFRPRPGAIDLAETVQDAGGYLNAEAGCDHTVYYQVVPPERWGDVLRAQAQAITGPAFDPGSVEDERSVIIEETRGAEADPASFLWRRLMEAAFLTHPCRRPIAGTEDSLARITADDLRAFHLQHYVPSNMVQVVVGDVDPDRVVEVALETLGAPSVGAAARPSVREGPATGVRARAYAGAWEQASVAMAFQAPPILHADVPALDVACGLLGVGRSSRLRRHLQTELGLVGDVRAGVVAYRDVGIVTVSAHVVGHDVDRVVEGVFEQIERLRAQPVLAGELEKMLRRLEAGYVLEHETAGSIAGGIGLFETLGDYRYFEDYVDRLAAVTPNDVLRVARDHLSPAVARVVTYGPEAAGLPVGDRSREIARLAERVRDAAPAVVAERPSVWEPSKAFERPVLLAERGASACSRELLGSGAVLVVSEARALPVASIAVALRGGFVDEPDDLAGVTYLTQKLTLRGAGGRSADEVADAIEGLGSAIAMAIDRDGFGYGMTLLSEHLPEGLGILGDVLAEPGLPADQLERVRREVQTEIRQLTDHPLRRALLLVLPLAFPGHRYGRPLRGTSAGVARIARSDVEGWHARIFDAGNLIVSAVGDVDRGAAREAVERLGERLRGGERSAPVGPVVDPPSGQSDVAHGRAAQSTIAVALRGPRAGASDDVAVRVLCRACSMMGGRLWRALRERPPHAYAVGASSIALRSGGLIFAHATAPVGQEDAAVEALAGELSRLATGGLAREELERAKRHLVGMLALSMERGAARAASYAMAEATGPGCEYVDRMPDLVRSTTGRDVSSAAERYLGAGSGRATVILRGVTAD